MIMIMCFTNAYTFDGYNFEYHHYLGPHQLRKDGEPRRYPQKGFWDAFEKWIKLPEDEREKYKMEGGCQLINYKF